MKEFISQYLPMILSSGFAIVSAAVAFIVSFLNSKKAKYQLQTKTAEFEIQKAELEKSKTELEKTIFENSYILCPNCGEKITLKDMKFYVKENSNV